MMRVIPYENLPDLSYDAVREFTVSVDHFTIEASREVGKKISTFLNAENEYRSRKRTLASRLKFLRGAIVGFSIIPFITVWNNALLNGFGVEEALTARK